jgi:hypothetical protein
MAFCFDYIGKCVKQKRISVIIARSDKCVRHKVLCPGHWHGQAARPAARAIRNDKYLQAYLALILYTVM